MPSAARIAGSSNSVGSRRYSSRKSVASTPQNRLPPAMKVGTPNTPASIARAPLSSRACLTSGAAMRSPASGAPTNSAILC